MNYTVQERVIRGPQRVTPEGAIETQSSFFAIRDAQGHVVAELAPGTDRALAHQFAAAPELLQAAERALIVLQRLASEEALGRLSPGCTGECLKCDVDDILVTVSDIRAAVARAKGGENGA